MKRLDLADFYWGIFAAVVGAVWVLVLFIRDRNAASVERSSELIKRLHELDLRHSSLIQNKLSRLALGFTTRTESSTQSIKLAILGIDKH